VSESTNGSTSATVPEPVVKIDNERDPFATVVTIEYGDRLGELLDTVASLKALGLNIRRAKLKSDKEHRFYVTDARNSEKILRSAKLEEIRLTILNNLLAFHPESGEQLAWGNAARAAVVTRDADITSPLGARRGIVTQIEVREHETGTHSVLLVNTLDRPGLLTDIVRVLKDVNLNVVSAEVDTIGRNAVDRFNITYHGEPLSEPMCQLVTNALQYYLSQGEVEKEWSESY
jgi:UTP:GlnB (protein PII) uridylyltransferase